MSTIYGVSEKMSDIRVKLYPNNLEGVDGAYFARNESETPLNIEEICAFMKNRAGFTGNYKDAVGHVKLFMDEAMYQLCNGKSVNTGYYSVHAGVGGTFNSPYDTRDRKKNPVKFKFRPRRPMRNLIRETDLIITGVADTGSYIDEFTGLSDESVNETVIPGEQFVISGHKIKVDGKNPDCGVYFEPVGTDDKQRVKVEGRLAENTPRKIIGVVPALAAPGMYRIVIVSQYTGSTVYLNEPRVITGGFVLETA